MKEKGEIKKTPAYEAAFRIVKKLREAGYQAYFAGGAVRDQMMGVLPKDYDIVTSARPEKVLSIFPRAIPVGAAFGVVVVPFGKAAERKGNGKIEVATFRSDGIYRDGRHPEKVSYTDEKQDAFRRDFTINGMFYDPLEDRFLDYVGGRDDLENGIIRTIGNPELRFKEDYLRLIRAVRFSAQFTFRIEPHTFETVKKMVDLIRGVSAERIRDELEKILTGPDPRRGIGLLEETGMMKILLPEVARLRSLPQQPEEAGIDILEHTCRLFDHASSPSLELAMGILLHEIGRPEISRAKRGQATFLEAGVQEKSSLSPFWPEGYGAGDGHPSLGATMASAVCIRLKLSNQQTERITALVRDHLVFEKIPRMSIARLKRFLRQPFFEDHLELWRLDCLASGRSLELWDFCVQKRKEYGQETLFPPPVMTGETLIKMGYAPGPLFKEILWNLEEMQLEGKIKTGEEALAWLSSAFPLK